MSNWIVCDTEHEPILYISNSKGDICPIYKLYDEQQQTPIDEEGVLDHFKDSCYTTVKRNFANNVLDILCLYLKK